MFPSRILYVFWFIFNIPNFIIGYYYYLVCIVSYKICQWQYNREGFFEYSHYKRSQRYYLLSYELFAEIGFEFFEWISFNFNLNLSEEQNKKAKENYMKAIDPTQSHDYICKSEQKLIKEGKLKESDATVFKVTYLTSKQQAQVKDSVFKVSGQGKGRSEKFEAGSMDLHTLKYGLKGWSNFSDQKGEVVFEAGKIEEMIDKIPPEARADIASHIRGESELNEGEG